VVAINDEKGKVKRHQAGNLSANGAIHDVTRHY
jgi:hypothetical protein